MVKVLLAGDLFVTPQVLADASARHLPELRRRQTAWQQGAFPESPLTEIGGVHEAVGDEDELIAALRGVDVCFTHTHPLTERVIANSPDLKLITVCRAGPSTRTGTPRPQARRRTHLRPGAERHGNHRALGRDDPGRGAANRPASW